MIEKLEGRVHLKTDFVAVSSDSFIVYEHSAQAQPDVVFLVKATSTHIDQNHDLDHPDTLASAQYPEPGDDDVVGNYGKVISDGANVTLSFPLSRHSDGGTITGEMSTTISVNQGAFNATTATYMHYKRDGSPYAHYTDNVSTTINVTPLVLGNSRTPYSVSVDSSYSSSRIYGMQGSYMSTFLYRRDIYNDWVYEPSSSASESSHEGWSGTTEEELTALGATYSKISGASGFYMNSGVGLWGSMNYFSPLDWSTHCQVTGNLAVAVENRGLPPVARFSGPETVFAGQPATFTSTSFDPDEPDPTLPFAGISSQVWTLDDSTLPPTWDERQSVITYGNLTSGPHTISLTVTDNDGRSATTQKRFFVIQPQPALTTVGGWHFDTLDFLEAEVPKSVIFTNSGDPGTTLTIQLGDIEDELFQYAPDAPRSFSLRYGESQSVTVVARNTGQPFGAHTASVAVVTNEPGGATPIPISAAISRPQIDELTFDVYSDMVAQPRYKIRGWLDDVTISVYWLNGTQLREPRDYGAQAGEFTPGLVHIEDALSSVRPVNGITIKLSGKATRVDGEIVSIADQWTVGINAKTTPSSVVTVNGGGPKVDILPESDTDLLFEYGYDRLAKKYLVAAKKKQILSADFTYVQAETQVEVDTVNLHFPSNTANSLSGVYVREVRARATLTRGFTVGVEKVLEIWLPTYSELETNGAYRVHGVIQVESQGQPSIASTFRDGSGSMQVGQWLHDPSFTVVPQTWGDVGFRPVVFYTPQPTGQLESGKFSLRTRGASITLSAQRQSLAAPTRAFVNLRSVRRKNTLLDEVELYV